MTWSRCTGNHRRHRARAKSGKPVQRVALRDAIAAISWRHCKARSVSTTTAKSSNASSPVLQLKHDTAHPVDDLVHQYHYVGVAPGV
jgi:hypothetical protein